MRKTRIHFLTILIGFSQIFAWATTYYLPATLINVVSADLRSDPTLIIGGFSWALLIGGLAAPQIGSWIDSKGGRIPLFTGSILMGIGLIVLSQTNGLIIWYIAWSIIGLGMALGLFNATFATIGRLFGQNAKSIIMRITLISGFATLFWPILTYFIHHYGWKTTVFLCAIPHILFWAPLYYFFVPKEVPDEEKELTQSQIFVVPEKVKLVFYLLALYATLRAMVGTVISVEILRLFQGLGIALGTAAVIASFIGPSQIAGRILEMFFGQKFNALHTSIFWTAVLPFAILLLVIVGQSAAPLFSIVYGMSNGVLTITMSILPMILFGSKGYASLLGKLALPVLVAQAASPLLISPIIKKWPAIHVFILGGFVVVIALICLVGLVVISPKYSSIEAKQS